MKVIDVYKQHSTCIIAKTDRRGRLIGTVNSQRDNEFINHLHDEVEDFSIRPADNAAYIVLKKSIVV